MNNSKISIIICAYTMSRYQDTLEAVESVLAQTVKPDEVILSIDHNQELLERFQEVYCSSKPESQYTAHQVKLVFNKGIQGLSETRNVGIHAADGDIIAFLDDDATAEKDWLEKLVTPFENPNVMAVGGRANPVWPKGKRPIWFPEEIDWIIGCTWKGLQTNGNEIRNVPGCNMAFRKIVFQKARYFQTDIGGLNETPRGGEEALLCLNIRHVFPKGLILYESSAVIHHKVTTARLSLAYVRERAYNEGFYKRIVEKVYVGSYNQKALSTESSYLHYLLFKAIPERMVHFYRRDSLLKAGVISLSIVAAGTGYIRARIGR